MPSTKCEGLSYPTHFLKSKSSIIRNNLLEYRYRQAPLFARRNDLYAFSLHIKKNIYSLGNFRAPLVTQFKVKV